MRSLTLRSDDAGLAWLLFTAEDGVSRAAFVYRTYVPDKWLRWVRRHWLNSGLPNAGDEENDLVPHAGVIRQIKDLLRDAKDNAFPSHMNGPDREILEYPLAR